MALLQTKIIQKRFSSEYISKEDLSKKLKTNISKINEYILGDTETPDNMKIIPDKNGMVNVEYSKEIEVPKYELL